MSVRYNRIGVRDALYIISGSAPTNTDDVTKGYYVGLRWLYGVVEYVCTNNNRDVAVWTVMGGGGAPTASEVISVLYTFDSTPPAAGDDDLDGQEIGSRWITLTDEYICIDNSTAAAVWKITTADAASEISATASDVLDGTTVQSQLDSIADFIRSATFAVIGIYFTGFHVSVDNFVTYTQSNSWAYTVMVAINNYITYNPDYANIPVTRTTLS